MELELKQTQTRKQKEYEEMEELSNQVAALKSKKILLLNGQNPYSKINEINRDFKKEENFKFSRIKKIRETASSNFKAKSMFLKAKERELKELIEDTKSRLKQSEEHCNDASSQLSKLSLRFSKASQFLKSRILEIKQNVEIIQRVDKAVRNESSQSRHATRSIPRASLIHTNKIESQEILDNQHGSKIGAIKKTNKSKSLSGGHDQDGDYAEMQHQVE